MALVNFAQAAVTTTPAQAVATNRGLRRGLLIKAHVNNNGFVYVNTSNAVNSTNGFELWAGESLFVPIDNQVAQKQTMLTQLNGVWLVASVNTQRVSLMSK